MLVMARSADLFSTWVATPHLELEANPIARRLGWRWGIVMNVAMSLGCAAWPLLAVSLATTSCLVAARNFQNAWLMRSMGETGYRMWFADRVAAAPRGWVWLCFLSESLLTALIGAALMLLGPAQLIPFSIGLGIFAYGFAVGVFTGLSLWRFHRSPYG